MNSWRPIETAPNTVTRFVALDEAVYGYTRGSPILLYTYRGFGVVKKFDVDFLSRRRYNYIIE